MPRTHPLEKTRNIGIIAHIDAGKTTVTERILYYTGKSYKIGEVHEGEAIMDWMAQERERGITITAAATTTFWHLKDKPIDKYIFNIIDTPGHIDFTVEVQRSLRVLDSAIVVFDGVAGVEPQSETVWRQADKYNVPRICFINKLDRLGASFDFSFKTIQDRLTKNAIAMQIPIGLEANFKGVIDLLAQKAIIYKDDLGKEIKETEIPADYIELARTARGKLVEKIVETDEAVLHHYLNGKEISVDQLRNTLRHAVLHNKLVPVFAGSALKNKAIQPLLDAVIYYLPSPLEVKQPIGHDPKNEEKQIPVEISDELPFAALAFKVATDPFVGSLTFIRVYSGVLKSGQSVYNSAKNKEERVGRIVRLHANHREEIKEVYAGDIAAAIGLKLTSTGDTLCDPTNPILLESIEFPEPVISMAVEPKTKADQEKMGVALQRLAQEDPTFRVGSNTETGETIISGMGELHLEIIVDRMKREFKVDAKTGTPQVAYKETIKTKANAESKYIRQTGGRGQYGHVWLEIEPLQQGQGFEFVDKIRGGAIPSEFIPAVEKGVKQAMGKGIIAGYPMVDVRATVYDGSYHDVDSSELAFHIAGSLAFQTAAKKASPILLEPIMKVEVIIPNEFLGDVMGDLNSKRARIIGQGDRGQAKNIDAFVPLVEMFGYATNLRSMTQGRGSYTMEFKHYEQVPRNIAENIAAGRTRGR